MAKKTTRRSRCLHADLQSALIQASAEALTSSGIEALSLRKIADVLGVSHNAPYMHFRDKDSLLAGVAREGFTLLRQSLEQTLSIESESSWREKFHIGCLCYVLFCRSHSGYVAAMFRKYDATRYPELFSVSMQSIEPLYAVLEEGQQQGLVKQLDIQSMASAIWSMLHGISMLVAFRDDIPKLMGESQIDQLVRNLIELLLVGLEAN